MESESSGATTAANWYPDPLGHHEYRYWDGTAWTENVSDAGQVAGDPLEAAAERPVAPVAPAPAVVQASSPAKPASHRTRKFAIAAVVLVVVAVAGFGGCSVLGKSTAARNAASSSIVAARAAMTAADPAVEPGSPELTESQKGVSELEEATALLAQGSLFNAAPYAQAKAKADAAKLVAQAITARVTSAAAEAAAASPEDAVDLYFALAAKYPRTPQGQDAITKAANALVDNLNGTDLDNLDAVKDFCDTCPGDVPGAVYDAAAKAIKSIADGSVDAQAAVVSSNKSWVKKIRGKGVNFTISSTSAGDTSDLTHVLGTLDTVHGTDYRSAVTLLRDSSKLGQACGKIASSPVRRKGTVSYFSRTQVNKISKLSSQMSSKISKARGQLQDL